MSLALNIKKYSRDDIAAAYEAVGVRPGKVVFVTSDLGRLGASEVRDKNDLLRLHLSILQDLLGARGTVVVPTGCTHLTNTNIPFDVLKTPSSKVGAFSEFVRTRPDALRSFHPFVSYAALGREAADITQNVSRHAFGPETPFARMIERDAHCISIGLEIGRTATVGHHAELTCAVPYRYTKEFMHPVIRNGAVQVEPFYLYVQYLNSDVERDHQARLSRGFMSQNEWHEHPLGRRKVWGYSMKEYFTYCVNEIIADPYVWCKKVPEIRPWQR